METINMSGLNRQFERTELYLIADGAKHIVGMVRNRSEVHNGPQAYRIFVNADECSDSAKRLLERYSSSRQLVEFQLDRATFKGTVERITEGLAGGAFDGVNIPQEKTIMVHVISPAYSEVIVEISFAPETVQQMVLQMLAHKRWQQISVRSGEEATAFRTADSESEETESFKFQAQWDRSSVGSRLCVQIMGLDGSINQDECERLLHEIVEPIVANRFSPPFDQI